MPSTELNSVEEKSDFYIKRVSPFDADVLRLIEELDRHNLEFYSADVCYLDAPDVLAKDNCKMLGVFLDEELCGIGAVKLFDDYGEIKRMFVPPNYRGRGLSQKILDALIDIIEKADLPYVRLETGEKYIAAMSLYRKNGFQERGAFGDYTKGYPNLYMEKLLVPRV